VGRVGAGQPHPLVPRAVAGVAGGAVAGAVGQERQKAVAQRHQPGGVVVLALGRQASAPLEINFSVFPRGEGVVVQLGDAGLGEGGLAAELVGGVEPLAVGGPAHGADVELGVGQHAGALAGGQVVQVDGGLDLVVVGVAQAAAVDGDGPLAVGR